MQQLLHPSIFFNLQPKLFWVFLFFIVLVKRSDLFKNEDLRRQRVNGKREREMHRAWWWRRRVIIGSTLREAQKVLRGVRTNIGRVRHFCLWRLRFFERIRKRQKEWRLTKKHSLFKSSIAVKWRDMAFIRSNVYLPKLKKRRGAKMARSTPMHHVSLFKHHMAWLPEC